MMNEAELLSEIHKQFEYEEDGGRFAHKTNGEGFKIGDPVGWVTGNGFRKVDFCGVRYHISHLVYLVETGHLPKGELQYLDGDRYNLSYWNLYSPKRRR